MKLDAPQELIRVWFHAPGQLERLFGAWPVSGGHTQAKDGFKFGPRTINHFEIHVVLRGVIELETAGHPSRVVGPGTTYCLFPHTVHRYQAVPDRPLPHRMWIRFTGPAANDITSQLGLTPRQPALTAAEVTPFQDLLDSPRSQRLLSSGGDPELLDAFTLFTELLAQVALGRDPKGTSNALSDSWLEQGRALLDSQFDSGTTINDIADHIKVDRSHFTKTFHQAFGISPSRYLQRLRMTRARDLVRSRKHSVTEVALSIGYQNLYAFSHAYRRYFGLSPHHDRNAPD